MLHGEVPKKKRKMNKILKFKLLSKNSKLPAYAHKNDAGFDLFSIEKKILKKGKVTTVRIGVASEIPNGYFVSFRGRSGLAVKSGIDVLGGVIDSTYRGEWMVILANFGECDLKIEKGDNLRNICLE